jgi:hypothetical protein
LDLLSTGALLLALAESPLIDIFSGVTGLIRNSGARRTDSRLTIALASRRHSTDGAEAGKRRLAGCCS